MAIESIIDLVIAIDSKGQPDIAHFINTGYESAEVCMIDADKLNNAMDDNESPIKVHFSCEVFTYETD